MKANYKPFGESFKDYFKIGDLVTWRLYSSDAATGELNPRQMTGVIRRKVWFAKVFEATSGQFYNMSLMTLSLLKD
jgi:hypothetical protein